MNHFYFKLKNNLGLSLILLIGLAVECSNFQSMFFRFMSQYRPDWGAVNHFPALALSIFLLLCIIVFGIRKQGMLSWGLALLTCVVSFAVYSRLNLSWKWEMMDEVHFVVLILSGMLPLIVAYTTHEISRGNEAVEENYESIEKLLHEIKKMQKKNQKSETNENWGRENVRSEPEKKKTHNERPATHS